MLATNTIEKLMQEVQRRIGIPKFHFCLLFQNLYLEVLISRGLFFTLYFPSWVVVPYFLSIIAYESGVMEYIYRFHIFIKLPFGKSILVSVQGYDSVETPKVILE